MARQVTFVKGTIVSSAFLNDRQEVESALHFGVRLEQASATQIQLTPLKDGNDSVTGQSSIVIDGQPRWWNSAIVKTVSGAAGIYGIYVTAGESTTLEAANITITTGAAPANSRKIGEVAWTGTAIAAIDQLIGGVTGAMIEEDAWSPSGDIEWGREPSGAWVPTLKLTANTTGGGFNWVEAEQSREATTYGLLSTSDEVKGVLCPAHGFMLVYFDALWKESVAGAGRAALFIEEKGSGSPSQLDIAQPGLGSPVAQAALTGITGSLPAPNLWTPLVSDKRGILSAFPTANFSGFSWGLAVGYTMEEQDQYMEMNGAGVQVQPGAGAGNVTSFGGLIVVRGKATVAATFNLSIRYKATSGKITAKERQLAAWAKAFP